jgi:hypothetical protein
VSKPRTACAQHRNRHHSHDSLTRATPPLHIPCPAAKASPPLSLRQSRPPPPTSHCVVETPYLSRPVGVARAGSGISPAAAACGFHALEPRPTPGRLADTAAAHLTPTTTMPCHERRSWWPSHHHGAAAGGRSAHQGDRRRSPPTPPPFVGAAEAVAVLVACVAARSSPGRGRPDLASGPPDLPPRAAAVDMVGLLHHPGESATGRKGPTAAILGTCAGLPASPSGSGREGRRGGGLWRGARWCRRSSRPERGRIGAYAMFIQQSM